MMKNFLLYPTDPINYGDEIVDIKKRIGNIENILNEVLQKVSAKKPELELNLPGPSQSLDASITDEDLESIFSGFCASSPPFQSPDLVGPSLPGPSSQCRSPFFPRQQIPLRPRSLSVPPLLDGPSAGLMSPPPFGPTIPPCLVPTMPSPNQMPPPNPMLPQSPMPPQIPMPPPSPMPPMVMPPVELPHPSEIPIAIAASGSFKPEPVEQVLIESERFFTEKDIGRVAIALAKRCFFGEAALEAATLYGKGATKQKLAGHTLTELRKAMETIPLLSTKTQDEKEHTWKLCLRSIAGACKELRKKNAKTTLEEQPH